MAATDVGPQVHTYQWTNARLDARIEATGRNHGTFEMYSSDGHLEARRTWDDGMRMTLDVYCAAGPIANQQNKLNEIFEEWYSNGQLCRHRMYAEGILVADRCWNKDGDPDMSHWFEKDPNTTA